MNDLLNLLVCPVCDSDQRDPIPLIRDSCSLTCSKCFTIFLATGENIFRLMKPGADKKKETAAAFWGDIYTQLYSKTESISQAEFVKQLGLLEEYFKLQNHLLTTEVDFTFIKDKIILEVGSGSGAHSALLRLHGAKVISMDLTPERVFSTQRMLSNIDCSNNYMCLNADAENIPLRSNSVDMIYSNGVLHHSPNTEKCISEVERVLKPGGTAAMMLYCRTSALFYSLWFWWGLLNGSVFKAPEEQWLGKITEGIPLNQKEYNPVTRVYSRAQLYELLSKFEVLSLRKNSFDFGHFLPRGSGVLNQMIQRVTGRRKHPGGFLVYGSDGIVQSDLERFLSKNLGFDWNILVQKKI